MIISASPPEFLKPIYFYEGLWSWQGIGSLDCVMSVCVFEMPACPVFQLIFSPHNRMDSQFTDY